MISINFLVYLINGLTHFDTKLMVTVVDKIGCLVFRVPFSWPMDDKTTFTTLLPPNMMQNIS